MSFHFVTAADLLYAAGLAAGVALFAGATGLLSFSGSIAALVVGFLVFGFGGTPFAIPLLFFFFSSSLLSRVGYRAKIAMRVAGTGAKGATRDAAQVLANGGIPAILAVLSSLDLREPTPRMCMLLFLAALAAVNGDTWATEIGSLARRRPLLVTTLRPVEPGTSGAISLPGVAAALAGAASIALCGWAAWPRHSVKLFWRIDAADIMAVTWGGFVAAFADSILGASVQASYHCERCGATVETPEHCGAWARLVRGAPWITNDVVNLAASTLGVLFACILLSYHSHLIAESTNFGRELR